MLDQHAWSKSFSSISSTEKGWMVVIHDSAGNVSLLFVETTDGMVSVLNISLSSSTTIFAYSTVIKRGNIGNNSKHDTSRNLFILRSFFLEPSGDMDKRYEGYKGLMA